MKVAILAPDPVPAMWGGAERAVDGLQRAIEAHTPHSVEVVKLGVDETALPSLIDAYDRFAHLDLSNFDRVISVKYPAWMVAHPHHTAYMFHPLRGLYDTYDLSRFPLHPAPQHQMVSDLLAFIAAHQDRSALDEFFDRFTATVSFLGDDAKDLEFPGPIARRLVHWLDAIALDPRNTRAHFALSRTVASRPEYFPPWVTPRILPLPGDLPCAPATTTAGKHLFTASRLDEPKRHRLLIEAMAHVHHDVPLLIAGTGPLEASLRSLAAADSRIALLGFVPDGELVELYRDAIAVPFVPFDEDLGLICVEAGSQGTPTITCVDAGGPTEFVRDGVNGLISLANPIDLGRAISRVVGDPVWARRLGTAAKKKAIGITWAHVVHELLDGADNLLVARRGPSRSADDRVNAPRSHRCHKIVVLATYGISRPGHGGELRTRHLCSALARNANVHLIALSAAPSSIGTTEIEPGLTETIVPRSTRQATFEDDLGVAARMPITDLLAGHDAHLTPAFLDTLREVATDADLIVLVQPFLQPALEHAGITAPFVHDSQNVEVDLKRATLPDTVLRRELIDLVQRTEAATVRGAVAITTCSQDDAARLASIYGRAPSTFHVVPNGTSVPKHIPDPATRAASERHWMRRFHWGWGAPQSHHLAVFFGSWHPPNLDAAEVLIELASAIPELLIVSCGYHGAAFANRIVPTNIVFPGTVSNSAKKTLLNCAALALNPMRTGSGTNLKLVEFLGHGIPTISTPFGVRGLAVANGRELVLAPTEQFAAAIRATLADPAAAHQRAHHGRQFARNYDWPTIGESYRDLIAATINPHG